MIQDNNASSKDPKDSTRINEDITVPQVRVIDTDGSQLGVMRTKEAIQIARGRELDLVEIAPKADPPVCKIINYGKFKYEKQKREKTQRKNQVVQILKEIRFHPNTDTHDFEFKTKHAINFLEEGNKVKASVMFKGREMAYTQLGETLLNKFVEKISEIAKVESPIKLEGRNMNVIVVPLKSKHKKK
ncbi:MAG: translation initiation factor IF-3 [Ignavibacteriales bacterium]|nr:Translation initiation factor IF-3 [Ignavibacteriaceae bacterium]MCZ2142538.1 translation initiation factor IF-3 [Ignavibacteriales bacterium]WKZ73316.1 MAG: translation initiation factor IF-3 [Ignavibacteriaceae bacterium]